MRRYAWVIVLAVFAAYAALIAYVRFPWKEFPWAWRYATVAPYWVAPPLMFLPFAFRRPNRERDTADRIVLILTCSALVDALVLLPSLSAATWALAFPLAWTTWGAVAVALLLGARR